MRNSGLCIQCAYGDQHSVNFPQTITLCEPSDIAKIIKKSISWYS